MKGAIEQGRQLGDLLQDLVNHVSHRSGQTLAIMNEASVTLQQVILLSRLVESPTSTSSDLAAALNMSPPSISQMIDRLHQLKLVTRTEISEDRRKKQIALTPKGRALMECLHKARAAEYEAGIAQLSPQLRADLKLLLGRALQELAKSR
jgi:DNA-binding MarR family transcriptional regulator